MYVVGCVCGVCVCVCDMSVCNFPDVTVAIGPYNSAYSSTDSGSSSLSNSGRERAAIVTRGDKEPFSQRLPFTTGSMSEVKLLLVWASALLCMVCPCLSISAGVPGGHF